MGCYVNKIYPEYVNEERLLKILDSIIPKLPPFNILYRNEDLEHFKTLDSSIATIEDITKLNEDIYVKIS